MIYEIFKKNAKRFPKKRVVIEDESIGFDRLLELVDSEKINLKPFSHIALFLENSIEFVKWLLLASKYKLTLIPFAPSMKVDFEKFDIEYVFEGKLREVKKYKEKKSGYIIVSTSGSTSEPKPIVLSEEVKLKRIDIAKKTYNLSDKDTVLISTPMYHSLAQRGVLIGLVLGIDTVIMKKFDVKRYLELIEKEKVSFNFAVSNQLEMAVDLIENYDISSLKTLVSTSYSLNPSTKEKLIKKVNLYECYGTSEIGCVTNLFVNEKRHLSSVGKALDGTQIKIENGEILVKSPWRMVEYYKNPIAMKEAFEGEFFKTGDVGGIIDGYLYYKGRSKEVIKTGGISVYPIDIERELKKVKGVKEVAVFGIEDDYFGEIVVSVVEGDVKKIDLIKQAQNLAIYQRPMFYDIAKIPKNSLDKIQKFKLKEKYKNLEIGKRLRGIK